MARPPRIPVWLPWDQSIIYFITICVEHRKAVLATPEIFAAVKRFCDSNIAWTTVAAAIMPDHFHALISPNQDRDQRVTQFSAGLKRFILRELKPGWKWQDGVFDRLLRRDESAQSKWFYIRENPVRAGLVQRWEDWPYLVGFRESETRSAA